MAGQAPLRLGLIGAGRWGRNYVRTLDSLDGVTLARLASRNPESRALVGPDVPIDADWRALVDSRALDGVIVATPPALHAEMVRAAVRAKLPVLVEKPLTMAAAEARDLLSLARAHNVLVMVDHVHLFHPAWKALKRRATALGAVHSVTSEAGNWGPFRPDVPVLWDWGPHDLAMLVDLLGWQPLQMEAWRERKRRGAPKLGETVRLSLAFPGAVAANVTLSNMMEARRRRFEVRFRGGALVFDDTAATPLTEHKIVDGALGAGEPVALEDGQPLARAVAAFAKAVRSGATGRTSLSLGVTVVELLEALDASLAGAQAE